MTAAGPVIIYGLPYFTEAIPSPSVAIVVLSIAYMVFVLDIRTLAKAMLTGVLFPGCFLLTRYAVSCKSL